jgi:hypothetical protein
MKKEEVDFGLEVGLTVGIMSLEGRMEALYKIIHEDLDIGGICDTAYTMAWFATEFIKIHKDTNWEEVHYPKHPQNSKFLYRSEEFKKRGGYKDNPMYVTCWDDAAEDYAQWRIENFNEEEFSKINYGNKNPLTD